MAFTKETQLANRYGLDVEIFASTDTEMATALMKIDFANVSDIQLSGNRTWATGGQNHANRIGFNDPIEGTFKLSTQIMTVELLSLMAGSDIATGTSAVVFKNTSNATPKYYTIKAKTVWQDKNGVTYAEELTFHKACPRRAFNISYSGEGTPTSVDVEFDLMEDGNGDVLTVKRTDTST